MRAMQLIIWSGFILIAVLASATAIAQSNTNTVVDRKALHPTGISSDDSTSSLFVHFNSKHGFVYKTIGLPLIGEHYPFQKAIPDKISVQKYGPNESVNSIIIQNSFTKNAGYKTFYGISLQAGKLIWLGVAVMFGFIAVLSKNIVAVVIGENHPALNNLFWYGFGIGFFLSIFVIDDINNSLFGKNRLVYFDNANNTPYRVVVGKDDAMDIGAKENIGAYLKLGWNELEVHPVSGSDNAWFGKINVDESDGYLVFNIGTKNSYKVVTGVWKK